VVVLLTHPLWPRYGSPKGDPAGPRGRIVKRRAVGLVPSHPPRRPLVRPERVVLWDASSRVGNDLSRARLPPLPQVSSHPARKHPSSRRCLRPARPRARLPFGALTPVPSLRLRSTRRVAPALSSPGRRCRRRFSGGSRARFARRSPAFGGVTPDGADRRYPPAADPYLTVSLGNLARLQPPPPLPVPLSGGGWAPSPSARTQGLGLGAGARIGLIPPGVFIGASTQRGD